MLSRSPRVEGTYYRTASGFVNGETTASAAGLNPPSCTSPVHDEDPDEFPPLTISCTGGTADNYDLDTTATASLVVGPPVAQVPLDGCHGSRSDFRGEVRQYSCCPIA